MSVAVYGNDPSWTTSELIAYPQGRAAVALECVLMIMMFGQVRAAAWVCATCCFWVYRYACSAACILPALIK